MKIFAGKEANEFVGKFNLSVPYYEIVNNPESAVKRLGNFSFPMVLRLISENSSRAIVAKNEMEFTNILNEVKKKANKGIKILMQEFIDGVNLQVGLRKDSTFGYIVRIAGKGDDVSFRVCPINDKDAYEMISELDQGEVILSKEYGLDIDRLKKVLVRLSKIPQKKKDIQQIDTEVVLNQDTVKAIDARITCV